MSDAPSPPRRPVSRTLHGETVVDAYRWMQDRESAEVIAHLRAENRYCDERLAHLSELRETLFQEIRSRIQESDLSVPAPKGPWFYLTRTEEGRQYPVSCRRRGSADGPEEILLDANELAGDSAYFGVGLFEVSPDHALAAWSTDYSGAELYRLRFRDLETKRDLEDAIEGSYYGGAWSADSKSFFYTRPDDAMRPYQLWRHEIGKPGGDDTLVFQEDDERFFLEVDASRSEDWIFVTLQSQTTSEVWMLDAAEPAQPPRCVRPREPGVEYWVDHLRKRSGEKSGEQGGAGDGGELAILTTLDAPNGRIARAPVSNPSRWEDWVAHREDVKLDGLDAFAAHVVAWYRKQGTSGIAVLPLDGGDPRELSFDEEVRCVDAATNLEYETDRLRFEYESLVTPSSLYEETLTNGERRLLKRQPVLGDYRAEDWEARREWASAADGERIPISLVRPRDARGPLPLVLYGYGAYESNTDPWFSAGRLSLLERGVAFAIAHVRGGGELGRRWYEGGKLAAKHNSFGDLIACAEHLVDAGLADGERVAIRGGSAGGLLVAAALNQRPELFRAVVAEVPFVDVVNTLLDETLPLTVTEWEEWGNPALEEQYAWIRAWCPYENTRPTAYPRVLATAGLNDPRVSFWEPAKWVAELRHQSTSGEPVLLKTEMGAGHGGPSGRYDAWREEALVLAFLLDSLGC